MATSLGGLYQVLVFQQLYAQTMLNVFWYQSSLGTADLGSFLLTAFNANIIPDWLNAVTGDLTITGLRAVSVLSTEADSTLPVNLAGNQLGDTEPAFVAGAIRLVRAEKVVRDGSKRIAGMPSDGVTDGVLGGVQLTAFQDFAALLDDTLSPVGGGDFVPVLVNRASLADLTYPVTYSEIASVVPKALLSSQNTRKIGRGQ